MAVFSASAAVNVLVPVIGEKANDMLIAPF